VPSVVLGMACVVWYALGEGVEDEIVEREVRERMERKRWRWFKK
jgi:hypothetical protein